MNIYYINYDAIPGPDSEDFDSVGGASINCWIKTTSVVNAQIIASGSIAAQRWIIRKMTSCRLDDESNYSDKPASLEYFKQAELDGETYVFHEWPNESPDIDHIH